MKLKFNGILALLLVLLAQISFAQGTPITGVVSDPSGMPIPGANVLIKGTTTGVQTDFDGKFAINATTGQVLVFSYLGMKSTEVKATANMNVRLADDSVQLEGVVVTALGITRDKKSLGYATQKVEGDEANKIPNTNFVNGLSGKVAGLQIRQNGNLGGSSNVVIRGYKSISNNNQALFVIDGIPLDNSNTNGSRQRQGGYGYDYGNGAADINPADIESINVLKGAAATALYGSRAANGAIMITTKKGKTGQGLGVGFESSVSVGAIDSSTFVKYQDQYGQGYFGDVFRRSRDVNGDGVADTAVRTGDDASFGPAFDGQLVYGWDSFVPESPYYRTARPWLAAKNGPITFFKTPFTHSNTVSLNGGDDKGTFNLSYTNTSATGIMPNSEQTKNSVIGNATYKFTEKLSGSFMANYINTRTQGRNGTGYSGNIISNFRQWWATNADIKELSDIYFATGKNYTWNATLGGSTPISSPNLAPNYWNNPYFQSYQSYQNDTRNRLLANATINYKVTSWLDLMGRVTVDTYSEIQEERRANGSYVEAFGLAQTNEGSGYQRFNRNFSEFNYDFMVNIDRDLTEKINFKGVAGINIRRLKVDQILASTSGGLFVPNLFSLQNSLNPVEKPQEAIQDIGVNGYYAQGSLGYDDFLYLEGSIRRDVSSTLPSNNNEYYYPAASTSFVFSNVLDQDWLSLGKVRFGYARVGNDATFAQLRDVYTAVSPFGTPIYSVNSIKRNENLLPEKTTSWEAGLEMSFLKKRVGFDVSIYKSNTRNQVVQLPVSEATGYSTLVKNVGDVENKGIEVSVNIVPIQTENFRWDLTANWAQNRNKLLVLDENNPDIKNYVLGTFQGGVTVNATVGQPLGTIQGTDYNYLNGQRVVDPETGSYIISATNDNVLGNFNPDWTGGVNNRFAYKNVSLSFLIDIQKGGDVFSLDRWYGEGTGIYSNTVGTNDLGNPLRNTIENGGGIILPGVLPDGSPNTQRIESSDGLGGKFGYLGSAISDYIYDASYVKLREVTLGYTFSKKVLNNTFQDLYLGFSGTNLWIIDKNLPDADPEAGLSSGNTQGFQSGVLPTVRTFAFNLKAKF